LPPEIWVGGASVSQEQKRPGLGKRERSGSISPATMARKMAVPVFPINSPIPCGPLF
jgi:hypothetical protein